MARGRQTKKSSEALAKSTIANRGGGKRVGGAQAAATLGKGTKRKP